MNHEELARLEQAATAAPWLVELRKGAWRVLPQGGGFEVCDTGDDTPAAVDDAALIAAARNALPALLAALDSERATVARLRAALEKYGRHDVYCAMPAGGACECGYDAALEETKE